MGTWVRWTPRQQELWLEQGFVEVENSRTKQKLQMNSEYVLDIINNSESLNLVSAVHQLHTNKPRVGYIHAANDVTVNLKEIQQLTDATNSILHIVQNTTHTFGMTHPVERITPAFVEALHVTMELLQ